MSEYLLHRISRGDEGAVRECIERFGGLVHSIGQRMGLPREELDDAVHEVFTEVWRSSGRYDPGIGTETTFVAMIARRRLIDRRRRLARQPAVQQIVEGGAAADKEPRAVTSEESDRARAAFGDLTPEQQRVLRLSVYEGLSHDLIARATGLPLGTVKTHARRGLVRLREALGVPRSSWEARAASSPEGGAV